jgi:hypothetical protein
VDDLIDNIKYFHSGKNNFWVLHPTMEHKHIKSKCEVGKLNSSSFIFGSLSKLIQNLNYEEINNSKHFCLVSANQYFINKIDAKENINYVQFFNTENWDKTYNGKDSDKTIIGFPLKQPYGRWDEKNLYKEFEIETPMVGNWECNIITKEVMKLAKDNIDKALQYYPNTDMMGLFLPYMVLMSKQEWEFPAHFGTYDPSNRPKFNHLTTIEQVNKLKQEGYFSIKRVNYKKECQIKEYIRKNLMK